VAFLHYDSYTVLFFLAVLAVVLVVATIIRKSYIIDDQMELARRARRRKLQAQAAVKETLLKKSRFSLRSNRHSAVTERQLQTVKTPWGWPQHGQSGSKKEAHADTSASLRRFADRLMNPKRTKEDEEYMARRDASIRALLEDRYGRASRMKEMPYRKVKAPLLRDPNAPFDQLDSMPSSKADRVISALNRQPKPAKKLDRSSGGNYGSPKTREIKTPWGW
jgi:hypothetical protein